MFARYLRKRGFTKTVGYDPYGDPAKTGDKTILDGAPFELILLQDVLEHVEDPDALLKEMDALLAPGGRIVVGTPNAANIDLTRPKDFWNEVHAPYHLHIYTRDEVEKMGRAIEWNPVGFYNRPYHDVPVFGINSRATKVYQQLADGTMDSLLENINPLLPLTSPKFLFYGTFGYWLSFRSDMTVVFEKPK